LSIKRIIPCLDIRNGKVVKGVNFQGNKEVGDPIELAGFYNAQGADELVFYDIDAAVENRGVFADLLNEIASAVTIPLTVAGGVMSVRDFEWVLSLGADRVSINTGAIVNPDLIAEVSKEFGSERVVFAMDVKRANGQFMVFRGVGKINTGLNALDWARKAEADGAGEIVVNSIDTDGVRGGFDLEMLEAVSNVVNIPIVASGGAGKKEDFFELFTKLPVISAGLAASIFHNKEVLIRDLKAYLGDCL
jgi:cyclase